MRNLSGIYNAKQIMRVKIMNIMCDVYSEDSKVYKRVYTSLNKLERTELDDLFTILSARVM
jgi:hypothetical protein